jgi:sec-independent protein translocase protein TatB
MFDVSGVEFIFLVLLGLLIFGPRKLPEMGKQLGTMVGQFRRAMREFQTTLDREVELQKLKETAGEVSAVGTELQQSVRRELHRVAESPAATSRGIDATGAEPSAPSETEP